MMQTLFAMAVDICCVRRRAKLGPAQSLGDRARDRTVGGVRSRNRVGNKTKERDGKYLNRTKVNNGLGQIDG
jgi:hypothetical protein